MKQFREIYDIMYKWENLLADAYDSGLEIRAGVFFYDPKTKAYNDEFKDNALNVITELKKYSLAMRRIGVGVAAITCLLLHPNKTKKAGELIRQSYKKGIDLTNS